MTTPLSTTELLTDLVAFDTTSRNSNLALIDYLSALLQSRGIQSELTFDRDKRKANLFATLGESREPGIVLSGHTDVVPVDGQDWDTDPFQTQVRGERMYGRGVCDMKGFLAVCLSRLDEILEADLPIPLHFAFSYDEEVGCIGVQGLLQELVKRPVQPRACIIGEPTSMGVIRAHKGMLYKRCRVHGRAAHSSLIDHGVNAITAAARILARIDDIQARIRQQGPFDTMFDPPYTTLHVGTIRGGTVNNIIPELCQFDFEIRNLPQQPPQALFDEVNAYAMQELVPAMQAVAAESGIQWETLAEFPGMDTPPDAAVIKRVSALLGTDPKPGKVSYGTEGGHFQAAGIATVICGPGSIEQAHKPNEFIDLEQLRQGERFISALVRSLAPSA